MNKILIHQAKNEIDASIIKGRLEYEGIPASVSSLNNNSPLVRYGTTTSRPFGVYVDEDKAEKAKEILGE